jgi:hypothetical protein
MWSKTLSRCVALVCSCFAIALEAQELVVLIDAQTGKISYEREGKTLKKPHVRKGETIVIQVQNYNNYLYNVEIVEHHEDEIPVEGGGALPFNKINGLGFNGLIGSVPTNSTTNTSFVLFKDESVVEHQSNSIQKPIISTSFGQFSTDHLDAALDQPTSNTLTTLRQAGWTQLKDLLQVEMQIQTTSESVRAYEQRKLMRTISVAEVEKMRLNPHLPPVRLRQHCLDLLTEALHLEPGQLPSLHQVLELNNDIELLHKLQKTIGLQERQFKFGVQQLQLLDGQLVAEIENPETDIWHQAFHTQLNQSSNTASLIDQIEEKLDSLTSTASETPAEDILGIWYMYEAIQGNAFSTTYRTVAKHDVMSYRINFIQKTEATAPETPEQVSFPPVTLRTHGGVKVNTSVGMTLGHYARPQSSWFVADGTIQHQEEDQFSPFLASYLHFYSQGRKNLSVGGSLGIGLPIGSELGLANAHLFVGPSFFFGNTERFVLNLGIMAGKTKHLGRGLATGMITDYSTDDLPLRDRYQFGYSCGLSFNIRG